MNFLYKALPKKAEDNSSTDWKDHFEISNDNSLSL